MTQDVHQGLDGWLFLTGGSNSVIGTYCGEKNGGQWLEGWANLLKNRSAKLSGSGIKYLHVAAPEKISIYTKYLSGLKNQGFNIANSPATQLFRELNGKSAKDVYLDPTAFLRQQSANYQVYHRTDTHWSFLGAYSVCQLIAHRLGVDLPKQVFARAFSSEGGACLMDLGGKVTPPAKENVFFYKGSDNVSRTYVNKLVDFKEKNGLENNPGYHVGSSVVFTNERAENPERILIFGDSFSEYRQNLLTGILAETFSEVKFVWSLNIDYSVVDDFSPDVVITEAAERFMPYTVPKDDFSLNDYVNDKIKN